MRSGTRMPAPPEGSPRFVAAFRHPRTGWQIAAESPSRAPVNSAVAEMIRTVQARGEAPLFNIWGPSDEGCGWQHLATLDPGPGVTAPLEAPTEQRQRSAREERLLDRRHQVLTSALAGAGLAMLRSEDDAAVTRLVDAVGEDTIRRLALWLSQANCQRG